MSKALCNIQAPFMFPGMTFDDYKEIMEFVRENKNDINVIKIFDIRSNILPYKERSKEYMWKILKSEITI